jgi:hypothetical protein
MRGGAGSLRGRTPRPHRLDQFLTDAERAEVAQFIDSLGPNPERENEFYERRSSLPSRVRNPDAGWDAETARAAVEEAAKRLNDPDLPAFVRDCLIILQHLLAYLDSFQRVRRVSRGADAHRAATGRTARQRSP